MLTTLTKIADYIYKNDKITASVKKRILFALHGLLCGPLAKTVYSTIYIHTNMGLLFPVL